MKFETPLLEATLVKRYKRFLSDVVITKTGETIVAHVPNSGSMTGVKDPGSSCLLSISPNTSRKLRHTLEMVQTKEKAWVGVNTSLTNKLVAEALENRKIPLWNEFRDFKREVTISAESRLDFVLLNGEKKHFVEVKNVSMSVPPMAVFPDAVTERGQKHLRDLMRLVSEGHGAEIFFVVQREDCAVFRPCDEVDPVYGRLLREAVRAGVRIQCWMCEVSRHEIKIARPLTIEL